MNKVFSSSCLLFWFNPWIKTVLKVQPCYLSIKNIDIIQNVSVFTLSEVALISKCQSFMLTLVQILLRLYYSTNILFLFCVNEISYLFSCMNSQAYNISALCIYVLSFVMHCSVFLFLCNGFYNICFLSFYS